MSKSLTRREFLKNSAIVGSGLALTAGLGCGVKSSYFSSMGSRSPSLEELLMFIVETAKKDGRDPVHGAPALTAPEHGGRSDCGAHNRNSKGSCGIDYDLPIGTPLVAPMDAFFFKTGFERKGGLISLLCSSPGKLYYPMFVHLSRNLIPEKYNYSKGGIKKAFSRGTIIALSGNSGLGSDGYQPPHLHFGLYHGTSKFYKWEDWGPVDPEKYGIDGGKPIYWDGETSYDISPPARKIFLGQTLDRDYFDKQMGLWPEDNHDSKELKRNVIELRNRLGDKTGNEIVDSPHFQDMRALLMDEVLEKKRRDANGKVIHVPGTRAYHLMSACAVYSSEQDVIITLPYPSPDLAKLQLQGKLGKNLYQKAA